MLELTDACVELAADDGMVRALDQVRLTIARGKTFALVGESGCGKSMTALTLMRLLPENGQVTQGKVLLDGADLLTLPEVAMRGLRGGRIGMLFQEPSTSLNPVMTVGRQIIEAIETHTNLRGAAARARALEWLQRVGIAEPERRIDDYPFRMSGGQKQRVMIAMTLAAEPDYLIADEPTTALDVTIQAQVLDLLRELQRERQLGLLLITHDLAVVSGMADDVALMYAGQIVEVAPAREFFASPRHPYAQALLRALPGSRSRGQPLHAIAGTVPALTQAFSGCRFAPRCTQVMPTCAATKPELIPVADHHGVRCLLFVQGGAGATGMPPSAASSASSALSAAPARPGDDSRDAGAADAAIAVPAAAVAHRADPNTRNRENPLLVVTDLSVRFPIRAGVLQRTKAFVDAVVGVSLTINPGQTLALVGESGCGKTTTGKAIVQLLRGQAEITGSVRLMGRELLSATGEQLQLARRQVQIVFQDPFASLNPRMRVAEILEEGVRALRTDWDAQQRRAQVARLIDEVGLRADALARYPHEFSGGQRQRIAIARALAVEPELLICDEPTSALDVSVQAQVLNLLQELQREHGVALLFITHNLAVVEHIADEVAVMHQGRLVEQGASGDVLERPQHAYTQELLAAVPRLTQRDV